ncbi:MAG: aminoacyl-tRNA hydrolase [Gemmatimonadaceae bacterium]
MKVILGLGNPGRQYEATRHNVGWWVLDHLADVWHFDGWKRNREALAATATVGGIRTRLIKPLTYMNLSGQVLKDYVRRPLWSASADLLVVVDDVALPVGRFRIRARGSAGGHNGLRSVQSALGSQDYARLRIGVGPSEERRSVYPDLADFVLAPFARDERDDIVALIPRIERAIDTWIRDGVELAMNSHNREGNAAESE